MKAIVQAKQETQDILAKIEQRKGVIDPAQLKLLQDAVYQSKLANAERERFQQYSAAATATEEKFGDNVFESSRKLRDLNSWPAKHW